MSVYHCISTLRRCASWFSSIVDAIIPPREHEALVAALTADDIGALRHEDGLPYHDPRITALVWEIKYKANPKALELAGAYVCEELLGVASEELGKPLLIPIPMHPVRKKVRGYNQTELLCMAALRQGAGDAYEYAPEVLTRIRNTKPQQTLTRAKRLNNVKGSMRATDPHKVRDRVCVVVDDVATTGATLSEARRALLAAGASRVYTIALARS